MSASRNRSSGWVRSALLLPLTVVLAVSTSALASGQPAGVSNEEWTSIQAQIEVERNKITKSDRPGRLYRADNPTQRFAAHFGADDVLITPRGGGEPDWQLGLRLTAWGAAHDLQPVPPAGAIAEGNRVEYRRGPVTEWYVNTTMGLEQGFTIEAPPADGITELVLEMTIESDLTAELAESATAISFRYKYSNTTLKYSGLNAWDAVEEPLAGRMELVEGGTKLRLVVGVAGAAWPITVDPIFTQLAKLLPIPDLIKKDALFGQSVSVDGDTMVVGLEDDEHGTSAGAAYILGRDECGTGAWGPVIRLTAQDGEAYDDFGRSTAVSGDFIVVGSPGVNDTGAAYIFERDSGGPNAWGQAAKLTADDADYADRFGYSVAIEGDRAIVGAYLDDDSGSGSGSAYVFSRNGGGTNVWGQVAKLTANDGAEIDQFGLSVALSDDIVVVGAIGDDDAGLDSGSAYVFRKDHGGLGSWGQVAKISPSDAEEGDWFGYSVAVSGDTAVVGAHLNDDLGDRSGSAYVFHRNQGGTDAWGQVTKLTAIDGDDYSEFGYSLAISGETAVIGSRYSNFTGSAYVFHRDHGGPDAWGQVARVSASDGDSGDQFGKSVAINEGTIVAGAPRTGNPGEYTGTVYLYERDQGGTGTWGESAKRDCPGGLTAQSARFGSSVFVDADTAIVGAPSYLNNGQDPGSAYVFERDRNGPNLWGLVTKLIPADGEESDLIGTSVSISGDTAIVGAPRDDDVIYTSGSAYIFQRNHGGPDAWGQIAKVTASDPEGNDQFGISVAIDGDTVIVGAWGDGWGSAYIFQRNHGGLDAWGEVTRITSSLGGIADDFGRAVAIDGDTAIVGANNATSMNPGTAFVFSRDTGGSDSWGESATIEIPDGLESWAFGVSLDISGDTAIVGYATVDSHNSAFIYQRDQGGPDAWGHVATITATDISDNAYFGDSVSISGDTAVIGAHSDDSLGQDAGSAFIFQRDQGGTDEWGEVAKITPPNAAIESSFGKSVAVSEDTTVVGAAGNDMGIASGLAYVFIMSDPFFNDGFETGDTSEWSATVP